MIQILTESPKNGEPPKFVTATNDRSVGGKFFAVIMWWNNEGEIGPLTKKPMPGFYEPWDTGIGRYATREQAVEEAKQIAEAENIPYWEGGY
jgi:hypothetical protein